MPVKSVFISHSSKDDRLVREIRQTLEGLGIEVWADSEQLTGGDLLRPEIQKAIEDADKFLVVVSLDALNSEWVEREIEFARTVRKDGYKIIPLTLPGVGTRPVRRLLGEEPVVIPLGEGPAAVSKVLPALLAALGLQLPTETVQHIQAQAAPVADLVLELTFPSMEEIDGKRRASANAKLVYHPVDSSPEVESGPYHFTAPLGPIEAEEIAWYLERHRSRQSGLFEERAKSVTENLPRWGRFLYDTLDTNAARKALEAWKGASAGERRFTVKVDKQLIEGAPEA